MKLFKIVGAIDKEGLQKRVIEIEVEETAKSYVGDGRRVSKDKLMKIDAIFHENHTSIRYYTYCLDGDQQKALDMLKVHVIGKVLQYKQEIDLLVSFIS